MSDSSREIARAFTTEARRVAAVETREQCVARNMRLLHTCCTRRGNEETCCTGDDGRRVMRNRRTPIPRREAAMRVGESRGNIPPREAPVPPRSTVPSLDANDRRRAGIYRYNLAFSPMVIRRRQMTPRFLSNARYYDGTGMVLDRREFLHRVFNMLGNERREGERTTDPPRIPRTRVAAISSERSRNLLVARPSRL